MTAEPTRPPGPVPPRAAGRVAAVGVSLLLLGLAVGLGFVAGRAVLPPEAEPAEVESPLTYEVAEGTVHRSLSLSVVASTEAVPVAQAGVSGTVTGVVLDGSATVRPGDVLLRVDERAVVAVAGTVPYYRDLGPGDTGRDVEQTQRFLRDAGYDPGEPDGRFGPGTERAVRQWRLDHDIPGGSGLELGLLVAAGDLPATLVLAEDVRLGATLAAGQELVLRVDDEPRFHLPLSQEQVDLVPLDAEVLISAGDGVWPARTGKAVRESDAVEVALHAPEGGPVCREACPEIDTPGQTVLPAEVVVVPETTGPLVPVAAITTGADGTATMRLGSGETVPVEVVASADGLAVVRGVTPGSVVVLRAAP